MRGLNPVRRIAASLLTASIIAVTPFAAFAQAPGGQAPPPPAVSVETVEPKTLPVTYEYAGRVAASREVEVRARVGGILLQRAFDEGSRVNQGDLLFRIDPATYEAQVALAKAQVLEAQANLNQAKRTEERSRALAQRGASSQATLDDAVSARQLGEAQVAAAMAQLQTANLSLDYATVQAPVSGITSLQQVPEGSLLASGDLLTKINQLDPIYVNFSAADTEAESIRELLASGRLQGATAATDLKVSVRFGDGTEYAKAGTIDFTSTSIDTQTGTILSRAVLPNPESRLLPGQFVRLEVQGLSIENAITLPTEALMQGPQGTFVYTLGKDDVAEVRPVTVGRDLDQQIVISDGLKGGETVIVKGVVKVRPGAPVKPEPVEAAAPDATAKVTTKPGGKAPEDGAAPAAGDFAPAPSSEATPESGPDAKPTAAKTSDDKAEAAAGPSASASLVRDRDFVAFADDGSGAERGGPPVPLSALPNGDDARRATAGITERAELTR